MTGVPAHVNSSTEGETLPLGAVIIPAHNEEMVIRRVLQPLAQCAQVGLLEIVVVANGCTDATAEVARSIPGVLVCELEIASKSAALNLADQLATTWPRLYLDADVEMSAESSAQVLRRLALGDVLAARPACMYDTSTVSRLVRRYYQARQRIPAMSEHLWGAGAYAMSKSGRMRMVNFPSVVADDLFVDGLFDRSEICVVHCDPVRVRVPRSSVALLRVLRRVYSGKHELTKSNAIVRPGAVKVGGAWQVVMSVQRLDHAVDALVYIGFAVLGKVLARKSSTNWPRDETTRQLSADQTS